MKKEVFLQKFEEALIKKIDKSDWQTGASRLDVIPLRTSIEDTLKSVSVVAEITRADIEDCSAAIRQLPISPFLGSPGVSEEAITLACRVLGELNIHSVPVGERFQFMVSAWVPVQPSGPPSYEQVRCQQVRADAAYAHQVQEALHRGDEDGAARPPVILSVRLSEKVVELPPPPYVEQERRV